MNRLGLLVAYPYLKPNVVEELKANQDRVRFLLDSGAFTAWKSGKEISVDEYCSFIEKLPIKPWRYFTLDKIGDPEGSFKNYQLMLERGFKPIPIFTRGESTSMIDEYYKTSDVIGIGGLVGTRGNKGFVKGIMKVVGDRKVHWLGFNPREFIAHYKPYMCDSSSWSASVRFASCKLYDKNGQWEHVTKKDFATKPSQRVLRIIREYGMDPRLLAKASEWKNSGRGDYALEILAFRSWTKYQEDLKNKLDVNFFLACAANWQVRLMCESHKYWEEKK